MRESVFSHAIERHSSYNWSVFQITRPARMKQRKFTMRTATLLLVAIVTIVGLWGLTHAEEINLTAPAVSSSADVFGENAVDATASETEAINATMLGVITCILGLLCGLTVATLIMFARYSQLMRFHRLRQQHAPIIFSSAFDHRGLHRFSLLDLSLLRI